MILKRDAPQLHNGMFGSLCPHIGGTDCRQHCVAATRGFTIEREAPRKLLRGDGTGRLDIDARHLGEQVTLMGSNDPLTLIKTLPGVATTNDLQASLPVRAAPRATIISRRMAHE